MDLNKLKTFYTLATVKSYTGCADKLCLTQSAVSHAIKKFEEDLGFKVIDRTSRVFKLTSEGTYLYEQSRKIFHEIDTTLEFLSEGKDLPTTLKVGAPVEFGATVLIKSMGEFFRKHPGIDVEFHLHWDLLPPLLADELDMVVDCVPHVHEDLLTLPLFREEYAVIASPHYVAEKRIAEVKDLSRCRLFSYDKELLWWKNFVNALPEKATFGFCRVTPISSVRGIINGALESLGVGFVPRYTVLKEVATGQLMELFPEIAVLNDQINLYLKERNREKRAFGELIAHIQSIAFH